MKQNSIKLPVKRLVPQKPKCALQGTLHQNKPYFTYTLLALSNLVD